MTVEKTIPVAQYLRMSTEHQQYSLENQSDTTRKYALEHGFEIVRTYSDPAKRGLLLRNRTGLKQLLKDVVDGVADFRAILVYDVSRWGRFQDIDESAHYEYLCKAAGIPVHYCAEQFTNDIGITNAILKALKRTMAGEYSRELSVKVKAGQIRLAKLGYKMGGSAPFGYRRLLLDANGVSKQLLAFGERKWTTTDRVTLVPGPAEEVAIVKRIFREFVDEHKKLIEIARGLNVEGIRFSTGNPWTIATVTHVLRNQMYLGMQVYGRTTGFLAGPVTELPQEQWIVFPNAFPPIITPELFQRAQSVFANFTHNLSDEQMLERLKRLLRRHGKLTTRIIENSRSCPGLRTYYHRFGGLLNVYRRLGVTTPELLTQATLKQRLALVRRLFIADLIDTFPDQLQEYRENRRYRILVRYKKTGLLIAVVIAHQLNDAKGRYWRIRAPEADRKRLALVAFLDKQNAAIQSMWILPQLCFPRAKTRSWKYSEWIRSGQQLMAIPEFLEVIEQVRQASSC